MAIVIRLRGCSNHSEAAVFTNVPVGAQNLFSTVEHEAHRRKSLIQANGTAGANIEFPLLSREDRTFANNISLTLLDSMRSSFCTWIDEVSEVIHVAHLIRILSAGSYTIRQQNVADNLVLIQLARNSGAGFGTSARCRGTVTHYLKLLSVLRLGRNCVTQANQFERDRY